MPITEFPELSFNSYIKDKNLDNVVDLHAEEYIKESKVKDLLEMCAAGSGAIIGYFIGDLPGAVIGACVADIAAKKLPNL